MGMTDRQFDDYKKSLLRHLEDIDEEIKTTGSSKKLDRLIKDLSLSLQRP